MTPVALTPEQETELLARYAFKLDDVAAEIQQAKDILDRGADDIEDLATAIRDAFPQSYTPSESEARQFAVGIEALGVRLSGIIASMLRQAGRLEGLASAVSFTGRADEMLEAHRRGEFGPYIPRVQASERDDDESAADAPPSPEQIRDMASALASSRPGGSS